MTKILSPKEWDTTFNVKAYGAVGDGTTNDTPAIQAALDAANTAGGGTIIVPPGSYCLTNPALIIGSAGKIRMVGYGATFTRTAATGPYFQNFIGGGVTNYPVYTGPSNLSFEGMTLDFKGGTVVDGCIGFMFGHAENVTFKDITFLDMVDNHALDMNGVKNLKVLNCTFKGFVAATAGREFSECIQITGTFDPLGADCAPFDNTVSDGVHISGCYVDSTSVGSWGSFVGDHGDPPNGFYHRNIEIVGNTIKDTMFYGIKVQHHRNVTITGNNISDGSGGIFVTIDEEAGTGVIDADNALSEQVIVSGNVLENMGQANGYPSGTIREAAMSINGKDATVIARDIVISNNILKTYANDSGILLQFITGAIVSGNKVTNSTSPTLGRGIYILTSNDVQVNDNHIYKIVNTGIQVDNSNRTNVVGNYLYTINKQGIYIAATSDSTNVSNNHIIGASRLTNITYGGIEISGSNNSNTVITNNTIRKFGSGNEAIRPIHHAGSSSTGVQIGNNSSNDFTEKSSTSVNVSTSETTASATYVGLTTAQAVTLATGTAVLVSFGCVFDFRLATPAQSDVARFAGIDVTGATTLAPTTLTEIRADRNIAGGTNFESKHKSVLLTGLTPGINTFTMKFKSDGTIAGAFSDRTMTITPIAL